MEKKYWIIVDGNPQGPFTADQLKLRRDFTAELPVWYTGISDWTTAGEVSELAALLDAPETPIRVVVEETEEATVEEPQPQPQTRLNTASSGWVNAVEMPAEPMPTSYLAWNIVMTLCCCLPLGVAGIFFSSMVAQKWQRGDFEGAKKASDRAAWCLILSFVLGLVAWPFQLLFNAASL